jgi:nitrogen fixation/metabolism regulation signal transduction histidine kinase
MLRRKMLFFLAWQIGLMVVVAVAAIWLLQGVLGEMDHTSVQDATVVETSNHMAEAITQVEIELREVQLGHTRHVDALVEAIETLRADADAFGREYARPIPQAQPLYASITVRLAEFQDAVGMLATTEDAALARRHMERAVTASIGLRQGILEAARLMREHTNAQERQTVIRFRWVVLGLAVVFLLMINVSVMMLLRMGQMVLKPVEALVDASRRLAREEFGHRVKVAEGNEFGELAAAFNRLAENLQANEKRKLETLAQTAIMLNHELNNASAIIKLQLKLLERQSTGNPSFERALRQINESLARMTATVEALKRIRRIVLTDYPGDLKMLDLEKSVQEEVTS